MRRLLIFFAVVVVNLLLLGFSVLILKFGARPSDTLIALLVIAFLLLLFGAVYFSRERARYVVAGATIVSVFTSLHAGLYDWCRNIFFPSMKTTHPVFVAVVSSLIITIGAMVITISFGLLWWRWEFRRKERRISSVKNWLERESQFIVNTCKTIAYELNIELEHYSDCLKKKKPYNWNRWERLVEICDLVKEKSGLYNVGDNLEIEEYINSYPELWTLREQLEAVIQGLNRIHDVLSNKAVKDIAQIHKASVIVEDVEERHMVPLRKFMERVRPKSSYNFLNVPSKQAI